MKKLLSIVLATILMLIFSVSALAQTNGLGTSRAVVENYVYLGTVEHEMYTGPEYDSAASVADVITLLVPSIELRLAANIASNILSWSGGKSTWHIFEVSTYEVCSVDGIYLGYYQMRVKVRSYKNSNYTGSSLVKNYSYYNTTPGRSLNK